MLQPLRSSHQPTIDLDAVLEQRLVDLLPAPQGGGNRVVEAQWHSLSAGGKRLRPKMLVLTAESLGGNAESALDPACAVEMVHTASLILDDLPCMDDSSLRRGRATCHSLFGEGVATLAAVSLLSRAFSVLSSAPQLDPDRRARLLDLLAGTIGDAGGMVAGQVRDLDSRRGLTDLDEVRRLAAEKTAGLFVCAARMGALTAGAGETMVAAAGEFGRLFGLCFQVLDDLADLEGCSEHLGKDVRKDAEKATFATLLGAVEARRLARRLAAEAMAVLEAADLAVSPLAATARTAFARFGVDPESRR